MKTDLQKRISERLGSRAILSFCSNNISLHRFTCRRFYSFLRQILNVERAAMLSNIVYRVLHWSENFSLSNRVRLPVDFQFGDISYCSWRLPASLYVVGFELVFNLLACGFPLMLACISSITFGSEFTDGTVKSY